MKSHLSATIENDLLADLNRFSREERRSRSHLIEPALEKSFAETPMPIGPARHGFLFAIFLLPPKDLS